MNSRERHEARRCRREADREYKRAKRVESLTLDAVASLDNLHKAAHEASRGVSWKSSVQRYMVRELQNIVRARHQLQDGEDIRRGFNEFDVVERGKRRHIMSVKYSERVIQKSYSQNVLVPALTASFIRNNTANTKGRGTDDAIRRIKRDLVRHYRRHGREGYILLVDFSDYFASIPHGTLRSIVCRAVADRRALALGLAFIDATDVGLGLGSEPNQVMAVAFPGAIDHMVTETCGIEAYGRYMDDSYAIAPDKETLVATLARIREKCAELGIAVNEKKTRIVKLSKGFTWLKKRIGYGENGRIVIRPSRESITRERRKLKKHAKMVAGGAMTLEQARQSYQSWRGGMKRLDAHRTVLAMDRLWRDLFREFEGGVFVEALNKAA